MKKNKQTKRVLLLLTALLAASLLASCGDSVETEATEYVHKKPSVTDTEVGNDPETNKGHGTQTPSGKQDETSTIEPGTTQEPGTAQETEPETEPETIPAPSEGLEYAPTDDGSGYTVVGIGSCVGAYVVIPETHDGKPVVGIDDYAFSKLKSITRIAISAGVEHIGYAAFDGCTGLEKLLLLGSPKSISNGAFAGCTGLTAVDVADLTGWCGVELGDSDSNPLNYAHELYQNGIRVTTLTIPKDVTTIRERVFSGCSGLTRIVVPDTVTAIGFGAFSGCSGLTDITVPFVGATQDGKVDTSFDCIFGTVPSNLRTVTVTGGTSISQAAFESCTMLVNVTLPDSMVMIGDGAFRYCKSLTSVTIPDGVTHIGDSAFYGCSHLTSIRFPDSVIHIGASAFEYCTALSDIHIPDSVTDIEDDAFRDTAYYNDETHWIGDMLYIDHILVMARGKVREVIIKKGTVYIAGCAFEDCSDLTSVQIPSSVTTIGASAFEECDSLTSIDIPNGVTTIGDSAFKECDSLTRINIPNGVTTIGASAFKGCDSLTGVVVPNSVTHIGEGAFAKCDSLTEITLPFTGESANGPEMKLEYIFRGSGWYSFPSSLKTVTLTEGLSVVREAFSGCDQITTVILPEGMIRIGAAAFSGCSALTSINIPSSVTTIDTSAFSNCGKLASIDLPNGVITIGASAFEGCDSLTSINIPSSVTTIGDSAFKECDSLTRINIPNGVTTIGDSAFEGCNSLTGVVVPSSVTYIGVNAFRKTAYYDNDANWKNGCLYIGTALINCNTREKEVRVKDGTTCIASGAFQQNDYLTAVTFPKSVIGVGDWLFADSDGLTTIKVDHGNTVYHAEGNCLIETASKTLIAGCKNSRIPTDGSVTEIGQGAFFGCRELTSITIPDSVTTIGGSAFYGCNDLAEVQLLGSPFYVGWQVLENTAYYNDDANWTDGLLYVGSVLVECSTDRSGDLDIREGTTCVASGAFVGCDGLENITIPDSVISIGEYAFQKCTGLTEIVIPDSVVYLGDYALSLCTGLTKVVLPTGLNKVSNSLLWGCASLTSIVIPGATTYIEDQAFAECSALTSIVIPEATTYIGGTTFVKCSALTSVVIPDSVTYIGTQVFSSCVDLTELTYQGTIAQWQSIQKHLEWDRFSAISIIHCTDGVIIL